MTAEELFSRLGITTAPDGHEHVRDGWLQFDCPYCTPDARHWRMGYNVARGYVNCWQCGPKRTWETLALAAGVPIQEVAALCGKTTKETRLPAGKPRGKLCPPAGRGPLLRAHRRYLERRRFDVDELVTLWQIEGIGPGCPLAWRIFIPIQMDDRVVSWTTRSISDAHKTRYRSAGLKEEAYPHKELLYGEQYCRHAVIINEGPLDAWAVGPGGVATCGTAVSRAQVARLSKYPVRVICFDAEPAAQRRAAALLDELSVFEGDTYNVTFTTGKDASRASKKELKELRKRFL